MNQQKLTHNASQNQPKRLAKRIPYHGLPVDNSATTEKRRAEMREYMRKVRAKQKIDNAPSLAMKAEQKAAKSAERARIRLNKKNAYEKEKRRLAKLNGKPDLRLKQYWPTPVPKVITKPVIREKKVRTRPEPVQLPTLKQDLSQCTKIRIDSRTEIFVKPGKDPEEARQRYLARQIKN